MAEFEYGRCEAYRLTITPEACRKYKEAGKDECLKCAGGLIMGAQPAKREGSMKETEISKANGAGRRGGRRPKVAEVMAAAGPAQPGPKAARGGGRRKKPADSVAAAVAAPGRTKRGTAGESAPTLEAVLDVLRQALACLQLILARGGVQA